jgi:CRISPR-associated protein Cas2
MLIISYDISNDKLRNRFSKFLSKFGHRLQYSVFEIRNSRRILLNIKKEIENNFEKSFGENDSVIIFDLSEQCKKTCFGYAANDDKKFIILS